MGEDQGWRDFYLESFGKVEQIRERIKSGAGLSRSDEDFLWKLLGENHNGVAGYQFPQAALKQENFQLFIQNENFLFVLEQFILTPNQANFIKFRECWSAQGKGNNPLLVNRVAAACTLEVSRVVSESIFNEVFRWLINEEMIPEYSGENDWFLKNIFLMKHIRKEFRDELERGETDKVYLNQFIWDLHLFQKSGENIRSNIMKYKIAELLKWKKQVILQGPPGTGKTYIAKQIAQELCESDEPGERWEIIQFHPAYAYEDFVRGIVANTVGGQISYDVEDKMLAKFAVKAKKDPANAYVLIIDEINRANLPAVLGELIYALEYRDEPVSSVYKYEGKIVLPKNLHIIGTMNTADRSIGNIDYAIRRRFAFVEMQADRDVIENKAPMALALFDEVKKLFYKGNGEKSDFMSPDFEPDQVMIGHSYFLPQAGGTLEMRLEYEIKPILREYVRDGILLETARGEIEELSV